MTGDDGKSYIDNLFHSVKGQTIMVVMMLCIMDDVDGNGDNARIMKIVFAVFFRPSPSCEPLKIPSIDEFHQCHCGLDDTYRRRCSSLHLG